jgi:hypothetical protein
LLRCVSPQLARQELSQADKPIQHVFVTVKPLLPNRRLQAELSSLHEARRDCEDTFTIRPWDPAGIVRIDTSASAQNLHVARAASRAYTKQSPIAG